VQIDGSFEQPANANLPRIQYSQLDLTVPFGRFPPLTNHPWEIAPRDERYKWIEVIGKQEMPIRQESYSSDPAERPQPRV
jgi:hypothetical protein